ncbi:MAG: hypothetical protein RL624_1039 [Bacteroidota bacterium]|jgi:cell division protein FtsL
MASAEQNNNQDWRSFIEKVSHQGLLKNMPFIIFLAMVSGLYIYSSQLAIDRQKKIDKLNQEIKELRWHYMDAKSKWMGELVETNIIQRSSRLGLKPLLQPAYVIEKDTVQAATNK